MKQYNLKELRNEYIDQYAWLTIQCEIEVRVKIIDLKIDHPELVGNPIIMEIVPIDGFGSKWVSLHQLNFNRATYENKSEADIDRNAYPLEIFFKEEDN